MTSTKFRTAQIDFAYDELSLEAAIARTEADVPGLKIEDAKDHGPSGWPLVTLVGTVEVLVEAFKKWEMGDAETDLDILRAYLADLREV